MAILDNPLILQRCDMRGGGGEIGKWTISTAAHNRRGGDAATAKLSMRSALGRRRQMGDGDRREGGLLRCAWGRGCLLRCRIVVECWKDASSTAVVQAHARVEVTTTSTASLVIRTGERRRRQSTWR